MWGMVKKNFILIKTYNQAATNDENLKCEQDIKKCVI